MKPSEYQAVRNLRRAVGWSVVLVVIFALGFSWSSWQRERARQSAFMLSLLELGERSLSAYFVSLERALSMLSEDLLDKNDGVDVERADRLLKRFKRNYPDLRIVIVAAVDGQVLATTETTPRSALPSLAAEPSFTLGRDELLAGQTLSIGRPFLGPVSKEWIIPVRYGLRDRDGRLRFLIGAGLPLSNAQSFWKDAPIPSGAALGLIRDDGFLVSRYPLPDRADLQEVYGQPRSGPLGSLLRRNGAVREGTAEGVSSVSLANTRFVFRRLSNYRVVFYVSNPTSNL